MSDSDGAFVLREQCGCVVAVTVEDKSLHYVQTVAAWQRSAKRCVIERMTVGAAKDELGRTFEAEKLRGRKHWRRGSAFLCRPELAPREPPSEAAIAGVDDARAEAALTRATGQTTRPTGSTPGGAS